MFFKVLPSLAIWAWVVSSLQSCCRLLSRFCFKFPHSKMLPWHFGDDNLVGILVQEINSLSSMLTWMQTTQFCSNSEIHQNNNYRNNTQQTRSKTSTVEEGFKFWLHVWFLHSCTIPKVFWLTPAALFTMKLRTQFKQKLWYLPDMGHEPIISWLLKHSWHQKMLWWLALCRLLVDERYLHHFKIGCTTGGLGKPLV